MARAEGDVKVDVTTDGERVITATAQGHPLFVKAAEAYVRSWTFAKHTPTTFVTNFSFRLTRWTGCRRADGNNPPVNENGQISLKLPTQVDVVAEMPLDDCDPTAGLDLSEPLRVFLTQCEADGSMVPCDKVSITLISDALRLKPARFRSDGREGFIVPAEFRKLGKFGAIAETPKGTFSVSDVNGNYLKGDWRVVIDHAPFQENLRYLANGQSCVGLIHFQWGEPEVLAVGPCQ
jgi:hypothetical protein